MSPVSLSTRPPAKRRWFGLGAGVLALSATVVSLTVIGAGSAPNIPPVNIASVPLYAATQGDKPALALALSVEFPTVGAQYVDRPSATEDATYSPSKEYIGYYNAEMCYTYKDSPAESPATGKTQADYKRFVISGPATNRQCADAFSGNFLNWASSSAIDMLRMALSGGDRYIDETNLTVLQRAVLPSGDPSCFWNNANFPGKQLLKGSGNYAGAVPQAMVTAANNEGTGSIWIANILNRIYFGTSKAGSCTDNSRYRLTASMGMGPISAFTGPLPAGANRCSGEGSQCTTSGLQEAWYGANNSWRRAPVSGKFDCSNATFGDPINGTSKACYLMPYSGTWRPTGGLNTDGFFYARVEVCGTDASGNLVDDRDFGLCRRYPNGKYKPSGTIQKYNNQLRLAAFGYALEQTLSSDRGVAGRYGGVLRAPMKYVGPRTYDTNGVENTPATGNPAAEWDPVTGIFKDNPDGDTTFGVSGVINYLNKFGRTGPVPGSYKRYDPASELYYETLRYLQGLPPSPGAVANLDLATPAQKVFYDGFPIYKDWSQLDPYGGGRTATADYACLKSNIALIGDINTWDSRYYDPPNNRMARTDLANNVPDIERWISVVQAFEKKQGLSYVDGQGNTQTTSNPNAANANPNTRGAQVYGLSYWAHTHDIRGSGWTAQPGKQRPGLRVKSFFFDVNEYAGSSDPVGRRNNNQYFTAAKYGGFQTQPSQDAAQPYNTKGNPFYDNTGAPNNNVWQDASRPGEAQTYFLQSEARGVLAAFEKIFSEAASTQRNIAGASTSGTSLTQTGSSVYQASFDTSSWWGDVLSFSITLGGTSNTDITISPNPTWSADQQLTSRLLVGDDRNIVVGKRGNNPSPTATNFTTGAIEAALKADLNRYSPTATDDGLWQDRLAYLRGNKSKEANPFRVRYHALGDVTNSGVVYVGAPSATRALGEGFGAYATAQANRTKAVYAGANDGMLHAFDATNGRELFAYIPSWMGPKLSALTDPSYEHQSYVDATPVIGDAKIGSGTTATDWRSVLVSGTGGGGRGVFALDVTDPTAFSPSKVLWEFTPENNPDAGDHDMGYVLGKPRIVKMRTSAPTAATATYRWFAMVPAGVNNYVPDAAGKFSATGAPTIFLLALDKPAGESWTSTGASPNYYKLSLPFDTALSATMATGIINLEAFTNASGVVEYVYAGDLHGRVWALDFTGVGASDWNAGKLSRFSTGSATSLTAYPMYVAKDGAGNVQPITAAPTILAGPSPTQHFVGVGTGKYIEPSDATSTRQNSYYALLDNGSGSANGGTAGVAGIAGRGRLQQVSVSSGNNLAPTAAFKWGRATSDGDTSQRSGWYYDFTATGERVINDSTYVPRTTNVAFSSLIPDSAVNPGVCSISGGTGNNYYMDLVAGRGVFRASNVGVSGQPLIFENEPATEETKADSSGRRLRKVPMILGQQGTGGLSAQQIANETYAFGRLSWRQINNYLELHKK